MPKERFKIVPTVHLVMMEGKRILLIRRFNTGWCDGRYSMVAGHVDGGETIIHAMVREAKEEAGIELDPEDLEVVHVMHRRQPGEERIDFFIRAKKWEGEPRNMEPDKCDDMGWFELGDLPINLIDYVRQAIACVLKGVFYSEHGW